MQEVQKKKIERRESVASVCRKKWKRAFSNNHFVSARIVKHVFLPFHLFLEMWNRKPEPMKRQKKISHYWISFSKEIGLFLSIKIQVHSFPYSIHSAISWVAKHLRCTTTLKLDWKEEKFTKNKFKSVKRIYQYQFWAYVSMNAYWSTFDEKYWKERFKSI